MKAFGLRSIFLELDPFLQMWYYTVLKCVLRDIEKKKKILVDHVQELNDALKKMEKKSEEVLEEKEDVMKELDGKRALLESKEREFNHLTKLLEMSKENEATALADRLE